MVDVKEDEAYHSKPRYPSRQPSPASREAWGATREETLTPRKILLVQRIGPDGRPVYYQSDDYYCEGCAHTHVCKGCGKPKNQPQPPVINDHYGQATTSYHSRTGRNERQHRHGPTNAGSHRYNRPGYRASHPSWYDENDGVSGTSYNPIDPWDDEIASNPPSQTGGWSKQKRRIRQSAVLNAWGETSSNRKY